MGPYRGFLYMAAYPHAEQVKPERVHISAIVFVKFVFACFLLRVYLDITVPRSAPDDPETASRWPQE